MVRPYSVSFRRFDNHAIPPFDSPFDSSFDSILSPPAHSFPRPISVKKIPLSLSKHAILVKIKRKKFIFLDKQNEKCVEIPYLCAEYRVLYLYDGKQSLWGLPCARSVVCGKLMFPNYLLSQ
jgi:hypothetical protein